MKKKSEDKFICHSSSFSILPLSPRKAVKEATAYFPQKKLRLHKSRFLQKLGCQKPGWDQARLSSLVNKQVVLARAVLILSTDPQSHLPVVRIVVV